MAIITEEPESDTEPPPPPPPPPSSKQSPSPSHQNPSSSSSKPVESSPTAKAFVFWAYFTLSVSLITLLFVFLSSLSPQDEKSWFLSLPTDLRQHYSKGRTIKVQTNPNGSPIEVFAIENGPKDGETVLFIHGLGCSSYSFRNLVQSLGLKGIHAVSIDLPGSGFSDKSESVEEEKLGGVFGRVWDVYSEIKEKGLFWGFDQLVETGKIPYEEFEIRVSTRKNVKPLKLGMAEMGRLIGQVIDSMNLAPVHLVLHDTALGMSANWVLENVGLVRSLTLVDSSSRSTALPLLALEIPVVREFVLGFSSVYAGLIRMCCSRSMEVSVAEAYRVLLKGRDGRSALVGIGKGLNYSFDLGEWAGLEALKGLPVQVLWSGSWSEEWSKEGRLVADAVPQATFVMHSGGRWPQEDVVDEMTEAITRFVSSLPKSVRQVEEEHLPEHIKKMFDEAKGDDQHHHHHHHDHGGHSHVHEPGYMDAYGLGHGWGS